MIDALGPSHFLTDVVDADVAKLVNRGRVVTRFPPEPNGFLHIGHAKSVLLNYGLAKRHAGRFHMRFDDTNPTTEEAEYVESILADVRWLGCDWGDDLYYASDYFERMYQCAERLVSEGKAYVDSQSQEAIREQRGSFDRPGAASPFRNRSSGESLDLLRRMRAGEFADGACVLRARIDMGHPNIILRDPLLYRIRHARHHRTADRWCIYPMYDYAHPLEDAFEGVTHSICTLEFESNRELYDWVLDSLGPWDPRPRQYEFARLALGYTVLSKRKLLQLVNEKRVSGWDDPRMPTIAGMRRRGVTPEALRAFAELIGVAKNNSLVDIGKFEYAIRGDLEDRSPRALGVLDPLPVEIDNWPTGTIEDLEIPWWPADPARGHRPVPFGRHLLIEREDFSLHPPPDWKRLAIGREVRLAGAYVLRCDEVLYGPGNEVAGLRCSYDPRSRGEKPSERRRGTGTIHWVHSERSFSAPVRLYDRLFTVEQPDAEEDLLRVLNPESLKEPASARLEPALAQAAPGSRWQFLRQGYFFVDPIDSRPQSPVFNRTITLKDTWANRLAAQPTARRALKGAPEVREIGAGPTPRRSRKEGRAEQRAAYPELAARFARYQVEMGIPSDQADLLTGDRATTDYFDAAVAAGASPRAAARWLLNELLGLAGDGSLEALPFPGEAFGRFVALLDAGRLTSAAAKALLATLVERGGDPEALMGELGLARVDDHGVVSRAIDRVLESQSAEVARYRAGEKKLFGFLLGATVRETGGSADPAVLRKALQERLDRR